MTVVGILDTLTDWVRENICTKIRFKVPPDTPDGADDAGYEYKRTNPAAFTLYVPAKDKLPPSIISPVPSVCVRLSEGSDDLAGRQATAIRSVDVELYFSTWSPGTYGEDIVLPNKDDALKPSKWSGEEANQYFRKNAEGWRDAWNAVDIALREIEQVISISGLQVDRSTPVRFGPVKEQDSIPSFYPFWFAWVSFSVTCPVVRNLYERNPQDDIESFL